MNPILLRAIRASAGGSPWYLAGGAPTPTAVYQPIGAASLAASYVNLVNPGTYDAFAGVAPTWASGTGWSWNASTQYLRTGLVPASTAWTMIIKFANAPAATQVIAGSLRTAPSIDYFRILPNRAAGAPGVNYNATAVTPGLASGVLAIAGDNGYRNGSLDTTGIQSGTTPIEIYFGASNTNGAAGNFYGGDIHAVAVYPTNTGHATWIPAVSAAMALL